mmetsp:Transcript_20440/g.55035  ORF Transcript_20440/g.55035 Transcript_20440/m.55035 type:complete len:285 (+) Transcript_20440:985-1839(+)
MRHWRAALRTSGSGSMARGATAGTTLRAQSAGEWKDCVADSARAPARRAGAKGSRSARQNAAMSTRSRLPVSMYWVILPRQMVVLVRMAGSSSRWSCAKARSTWASALWLRCGARGTTALTVISRSWALASVKPFTMAAKMVSLSTRSGMSPTMAGRCSRRGMRMARSLFWKSLPMMGTTWAWNSSSVRSLATRSIGVRMRAVPPPYSRFSTRAGSTLYLAALGGMPATWSVSLRKKRSFSAGSLTLRFSRNSCMWQNSWSKKEFLSSSPTGRRAGTVPESSRV